MASKEIDRSRSHSCLKLLSKVQAFVRMVLRRDVDLYSCLYLLFHTVVILVDYSIIVLLHVDSGVVLSMSFLFCSGVLSLFSVILPFCCLIVLFLIFVFVVIAFLLICMYIVAVLLLLDSKVLSLFFLVVFLLCHCDAALVFTCSCFVVIYCCCIVVVVDAAFWGFFSVISSSLRLIVVVK